MSDNSPFNSLGSISPLSDRKKVVIFQPLKVRMLSDSPHCPYHSHRFPLMSVAVLTVQTTDGPKSSHQIQHWLSQQYGILKMVWWHSLEPTSSIHPTNTRALLPTFSTMMYLRSSTSRILLNPKRIPQRRKYSKMHSKLSSIVFRGIPNFTSEVKTPTRWHPQH